MQYTITIINFRYINHASAHYNLVLMKPVMVGDPPSERLRIGFVARRYINKGEELFFNYGIKDKQLPWSTTNAKKAATTLQKINSTSKQVCVTICTCYYKYILLWWNKFTFVILTFFMFHYYLHVHICMYISALIYRLARDSTIAVLYKGVKLLSKSYPNTSDMCMVCPTRMTEKNYFS